MNRVAPRGVAVAVVVILAAISVYVTNALFNATASDRPSVTYSILSASPAANP